MNLCSDIARAIPDSAEIQVSVRCGLHNIDAELLADWRALHHRPLIEDNAYLTPEFVLPAIEYLTPGVQPVFVCAHQPTSEGRRLIGLGVFEDRNASLSIPFRTLHAFESLHSLIKGVLICRDNGAAVLCAMLTHLKNDGRWHSIGFSDAPIALVQAALTENSSARHCATRVRWHENIRYQSAALINGSDRSALSKSTRKGIVRNERKLAALGDVTWQLVRGTDITEEHVETFLSLEHNGWKKEQQTSLLSNANESAFFRTMIRSFSDSGNAFFCELSLNGRVVCSSCNLIAGNSGFAFKIGYDPAFSRYGVGVLNEFKLAQNMADCLPQLNAIMSGSKQGAYIDSIWKDRVTLVGGHFGLRPIADIGLSVRHRLASQVRRGKRVAGRLAGIRARQ